MQRETVKKGKPGVSEAGRKGAEDSIQDGLWKTQKMLLLLLLPLLLGAATSRCLHDETQKSVSLLRPPFPQLPSNFRSSSLTLPGSHDPQPLRIQTCYVRDPVSDGAWGPEGDSMNGESGVLAAVSEAAQRLQGVLAGEWGSRRSRGGLRIRESWGRRPPQERNWNSKMLR